MQVNCNHCFSRFKATDIMFMCPIHKNVFCWQEVLRRSALPSLVPCPICRIVTSLKICPACKSELPHYAGCIAQNTIAFTGCRASGKTVYRTSLIYFLREIEGCETNPRATLMFEDDRSWAIYKRDYDRLVTGRKLPDLTPVDESNPDKIDPMILRYLASGNGSRNGLLNLVFFDAAGELFQSLEKVRFVKYLAYSAAVLFLVDPWETVTVSNSEQPTAALGNICQQIRRQLGLRQETVIPKVLGLVLTKYDKAPGARLGMSTSRKRRLLSDRECRDRLRQQEFGALLTMAENNFAKVSCFAVSSLGGKPHGNELSGKVAPHGVADPIHWIVSNLL